MSGYYPDGTTQAHLDAIDLDMPDPPECQDCGSQLTEKGCPICDWEPPIKEQR